MKLLLPILILPLVMSCIWDKDTILDEIQNKASLYDLIIGQSPHHSDEYYRKRLAKKDEILKKYKGPIGVNTIAAAYIRLKEFDKAEKLLLKQLESTPKNYYTNSNLGVMYKKMGDYTKAVQYIDVALKIKPEGHMGLGDWYLKMLKYKAAQKEPGKNFLGEKYTEHFSHNNKYSREDRIKRHKYELLIKNDQSFADGFMSLGDLLASKGDLNLALRAYVRAEKLQHPNKEILDKKIKSIVSHISKNHTRDEAQLRLKVDKYKESILAEFASAEKWVEEFKKAEVELLENKENVNYKEVYAALKSKGIKSFYPAN